MKTNQTILIALALLLTSCSGGGAKNYNSVVSTTLGQELIDLQRAKESGAISEKDYQRQRDKLIEGRSR